MLAGVEPVIDSCLGVVAIGVGAGYLAPVIGVAEREELVSGRHSSRHALRRVGAGNAEGGGLIVFDAIPIAIGIDGLQPASVAGLAVLGEAGDAVGRGQRGDEIAEPS